jgi:formylglycine-generating enzyme
MVTKEKPLMLSFRFSSSLGALLVLLCFSGWAQPVLSKIERIALAPEPRLTIQSAVGATNVIESADELAANQWRMMTNVVVTNSPYVFVDLTAPASFMRFYRVAIANALPDTNAPTGMVLIPNGSFTMGDTLGDGSGDERPLHAVYVTAFYLDRSEVTKALWDEVYTWAVAHGYSFEHAGSGKADNHPVQTVNWWDVVKWCNARSEQEGRVPAYYTSPEQTTIYRSGRMAVQTSWVKWAGGYRLPTEAEWEYAAGGGLSGKRFPWGDTITHTQANYLSYWVNDHPYYSYDLNPTPGYHPDYAHDPEPYTSPAGSFAPNGYGLYDMTGNLWEWCWDWYGSYSSSSQTDPQGPASGSIRVIRGGGWGSRANACRVTYRDASYTDVESLRIGFRTVLRPVQ